MERPPNTRVRNYELQKFYYDTASVENPVALGSLRKMVPVSQILFGTDFPFGIGEEHVKNFQACGVFSAQEVRAIERENALKLLPRFRNEHGL
jgi:predicted TIM-barrel fold metal-dependent hydrolase